MAEISYNESDIVVTKGLEGLRLRPSMYVYWECGKWTFFNP